MNNGHILMNKFLLREKEKVERERTRENNHSNRGMK